MAHHYGDIGISWYGNSIDSGTGKYGEYMNVNNPHKVSLYMRCNSPVIAWSKAGRADFIRDENLGITVDSLDELDSRLRNLDKEQYDELCRNVERVNHKEKEGTYLKEALEKAYAYLDSIDPQQTAVS